MSPMLAHCLDVLVVASLNRGQLKYFDTSPLVERNHSQAVVLFKLWRVSGL